MARRENPVKELRQKQIKEAALRLFSERGFHNTTISQISQAADLGKGTIYWYWKSKEELAFSLVEDMLRDFAMLIEAARKEAGTVAERFEKLVEEVAELYYRETEYLRLLWKFRVDRSYIFNEDYTEKVTSYYVRMRQALEDMLEQGMTRGEFREMNAKRMAFILLGIVEGLELEWLENEEELSMREALAEVMSIVVASISR
ncbi:MAG: TetR/AcrR family transcriptional regulator [Actinomycetota bacterium]|nr:TetR/AcrR family transcriptional regulator [Actinomycetota bacterium]MDD5667349.1 TetR/AcrR family transcriptional regulator [Actinomycetota bacterium]